MRLAALASLVEMAMAERYDTLRRYDDAITRL